MFECEHGRSIGIHKVIVNNYVVCYVIDSEIITVTNVMYSDSDIHRRLENCSK